MPDIPTAIVIPAHNEEAVIVRTLSRLLSHALPGEFEVTVVCNGCVDRTAELVRRQFSTVNVVEISEASKTTALNNGLQRAQNRNVLLLDADIGIDTRAVRALIIALETKGTDVAIGHMHIDVTEASRPVRAFYKLWANHPYVANGKFAAVIALSRDAVGQIGQLPHVIADDAYISRQFSSTNVTVVDEAVFSVCVPRTIPALIRVRSRVHRGNRELKHHLPGRQNSPGKNHPGFLSIILRQPELWANIPWYLVVEIPARILSFVGRPTWNQDLSTRQTAQQR